MKSTNKFKFGALFAASSIALAACGGSETLEDASQVDESEAVEGEAVETEAMEATPTEIPEGIAFVDVNGQRELTIGDSLYYQSGAVLTSHNLAHTRIAADSLASLHPDSNCFMGALNDVYVGRIFCGPVIHVGGSPDAAWDTVEIDTFSLAPDVLASHGTDWDGAIFGFNVDQVVSGFQTGQALPPGVELLHPDGIAAADASEIDYQAPTLDANEVRYDIVPGFSTASSTVGWVTNGVGGPAASDDRISITLRNSEILETVSDTSAGYDVAAPEGQELLAVEIDIAGSSNEVSAILDIGGVRTPFNQLSPGTQQIIFSIDENAPAFFELASTGNFNQTLDLRTGERSGGHDLWYREHTTTAVGAHVDVTFHHFSALFNRITDSDELGTLVISEAHLSRTYQGAEASSSDMAILSLRWESPFDDSDITQPPTDSSILLRLPDGTEVEAQFADSNADPFLLNWPYWEVPADFEAGEIELILGEQLHRAGSENYVILAGGPSTTTFDVNVPAGVAERP